MTKLFFFSHRPILAYQNYKTFLLVLIITRRSVKQLGYEIHENVDTFN